MLQIILKIILFSFLLLYDRFTVSFGAIEIIAVFTAAEIYHEKYKQLSVVMMPHLLFYAM